MTIPVKTPTSGDIMESVLIKGDLAKLSEADRVRYYNEVCRSLGLNPLTQPFAYVTLEIVSREIAGDILTVHVRARLPDGRTDEDLGAVSFPETLRGEARANAELKAVTKAKRRATLSICGLGWLDETEVEDIPASARRPVAKPNVMIPHDADTGEIADDEPSPRQADSSGSDAADQGAPVTRDTAAGAPEVATMSLEDEAREAARHGTPVFNAFWRRLTAADKTRLEGMGTELRTLMDKADMPDEAADTESRMKARVEAV
jgi:hypothetical protein